jgi:hypothetical protein
MLMPTNFVGVSCQKTAAAVGSKPFGTGAADNGNDSQS